MNRIYAYMRASTKEQDANRGRAALEAFSKNTSRKISGWFVENESGATLKRPELFRLLEISQPGDVLLVEQVDRISRLNNNDWELLKSKITNKGIIVIALDLPTSHQFMTSKSDDFTQRMMTAINSMLLDMLAAVARKDYDDRRRRQAEGIVKAKKLGKYKGRKTNFKLHENIRVLLKAGKSYGDIVKILGCSRSTIAKISKECLTP